MEHFTIKNPDSSKITVHYYNLNSWSNPYIYYYTNTEQPVAWPGVAMTSDGNGWYSYDIYGFEEVKVIFSNNGTNKVPAQNQPGLDAKGIMWYKNGIWCDTESDTDKDELPDYMELVLGTDIAKIDTDGDTLSDGDDVALGFSPLLKDTDNNGILDCDEKVQQNLTQEIECEDKPQVTDVSVSFKGSGNINSTTTVTSIYNIDMLSTNLVGLVGAPIEIETESSFDEAVITFKVDKSKLGNVEFENLGILWYDEENDLFKMQETTLDEANGSVSATVTHFSKYMVVDKRAWFDVWRQEMVYSLSTTNIRTVLAIDCSGSMATNDPKFYYTDGNSIHTSDMTYRRMAADNFINSMTDSAKSSIVTFSGSANVVVPMTNDIIALKAGLSSIYSSGGTNFTNAIQTSLTQFENDGSDYTNKIIMLLTDGKSSVSNSILQSAVDEGIKIYTIGIGQNIQKNVLQNIADYTGGECYIAKTADEIVNIYSTIGLNQNIDMTDSNGDGLADTFETAGMRLSNGEIIYTDPLNADTDGDGLKDGEEIIPQFKFVDSSSIGLSGFSFGIYFKMNSDPNMSDSDGDGMKDINDSIPNGRYDNKNIFEPLSEKRIKSLNEFYKNTPNTNDLILTNNSLKTTREYTIVIQKCLEYLGYLDMGNAPYGQFGGLTYSSLYLYRLNHRMYNIHSTVDYEMDYVTFYSIIRSAVNAGFSLNDSVLETKVNEFFIYRYVPVTTSLEKLPYSNSVVSSLSSDRETIYIYDLTTPLEGILRYGAQDFHFHYYQCNHIHSPVESMSFNIIKYDNSSKECLRKNGDYLWMVAQVKNQAKYDIKAKESWNKLFEIINLDSIPFFHASFPFVFKHEEINAEIFGNILFGYIGNAGGFKEYELVSGGSIYSLITDKRLDNQEDSDSIRKGYNLYEGVKYDYSYLHITNL